MCFTPDGAFTYILGELDNSVTCCRHQDGVLSEFQSLSSLTEGTPHATAGGGAEIICHPQRQVGLRDDPRHSRRGGGPLPA